MSPGMALKALGLIKRSAVAEAKPAAETNLSKREIEMLEQIATGMSYEQVADNSGISYGTVRKHLENIYKKLDVHSKLEAVNKARKDGLL
jgi:DNA-binding CsgD family transcriptional regulator